MDRTLTPHPGVKYSVAFLVRGDAEQTMIDLEADWKPRVAQLTGDGFVVAAVASVINGAPRIDFQRPVSEDRALAFGMAHRQFAEIKASLDAATNYNWQSRRYERPN